MQVRKQFDREKRFVKAFLLALVALAVVATGAMACHGSWDGMRDSDADGASNRCESQAGTDPNNADSDADGVKDGAEDADGDGADNAAESAIGTDCGQANSRFKLHFAKVDSLNGNVLTLATKNGGKVTEPLADSFKCVMLTKVEGDGWGHDAKASHHGHHHGRHHGRHHGWGHEGRFAVSSCTTADLTAGTFVAKAKVRDGKFTKVKIVK